MCSVCPDMSVMCKNAKQGGPNEGRTLGTDWRCSATCHGLGLKPIPTLHRPMVPFYLPFTPTGAPNQLGMPDNVPFLYQEARSGGPPKYTLNPIPTPVPGHTWLGLATCSLAGMASVSTNGVRVLLGKRVGARVAGSGLNTTPSTGWGPAGCCK